MKRLRQLWIRLHRWSALGVGWLLILSGLTGALLVIALPLDRALNPALFQVHSPATANAVRVPLAQVVQQLRAEFGPQASMTLRPPRTPQDTLWVLVRGPWKGTVYLDPITGEERGRRGEGEGLFNALFTLHSSLWLQETGKALLASVALVYLVLLASGLILWWPRRWPPSWRIALNKGLLRALFDTHRLGGAVLGLFLAVSIATGAYMAWRPLGAAVTYVSGSTPTLPPTITRPAQPSSPAPLLDALVTRAQAHFPDSRVGYVQVPAHGERPLRIRLILPDDPHPNGLTSVWLHPESGEVLAVHRWNELDPGSRAVALVYPLHTGVLGGVWLETWVAMSGLALTALGVTGLCLWWRRQTWRRA